VTRKMKSKIDSVRKNKNNGKGEKGKRKKYQPLQHGRETYRNKQKQKSTCAAPKEKQKKPANCEAWLQHKKRKTTIYVLEHYFKLFSAPLPSGAIKTKTAIKPVQDGCHPGCSERKEKQSTC